MEFDFNISGMDPKTAKELVLDVARALGDTESQLNKKREDLALWKTRVELSVSHGKPELEAEARRRVSLLEPSIAQLEQEAAEIRRGLAFMKDQMKSPQFITPATVNADMLLQEINQLAGLEDEKDLETEVQFQQQSVDQALEALKRKMNPQSAAPEQPEQAEPATEQTNPQTGPQPKSEPNSEV